MFTLAFSRKYAAFLKHPMLFCVVRLALGKSGVIVSLEYRFQLCAGGVLFA